jgi:hypothetical protein
MPGFAFSYAAVNEKADSKPALAPFSNPPLT